MPRSHKAFSLRSLGGHKVHKMVKFRPRGMVDKREMEQAQLFETADERGCTPTFGAAHRRASAVPYPRRYEVCSLFIARDPHTAQPFAAHGLFGVQALACPGQCSLKAELKPAPAMTQKFDHFVNFVRSNGL